MNNKQYSNYCTHMWGNPVYINEHTIDMIIDPATTPHVLILTLAKIRPVFQNSNHLA